MFGIQFIRRVRAAIRAAIIEGAGYLAGREGYPRHANPEAFVADRLIWDRGWLQGHIDHIWQHRILYAGSAVPPRGLPEEYGDFATGCKDRA